MIKWNKEIGPRQIKTPKWVAVVLVAVCLIVVFITFDSGDGSAPSSTTAQTNEQRDIGMEGYLRLPTTSDPEQVICLAPNKEVHDEYFKALSAKDYLGIAELAEKGLFCVGGGTKALVIDTSFALTRVRVLEGSRDIDSDKIGQSGWTVKEWVAKE